MPLRRTTLLALTLTLPLALTACGKDKAPAPVVVIKPNLIDIPADLRKCAETSGVKIPAGALTVSQVETLWKDDRIRLALVRGCFRRALAFYDAQKKRLSR
jgi:hypothetical protein